MKKPTVVLTLLLTLVLLFTSCTGQMTPGTETGTQAETETEIPAVELEKDAYSLTFTSNGDGTCTLSGLTLTKEITSPSALTVPAKSPDGDKVTSIGYLGHYGYANVPRWIDEPTFQKIEAGLDKAVQDGKITQFFRDKCSCFYTRQDLSEQKSDLAKQQMLQKYPITETTVIYTLETDVLYYELALLSNYIHKYVGFTNADRLAAEAALQYESAAEWSLESLVSLTLPDTLQKVSEYAFTGLVGLKKLVLPEGVTEIAECAFAESNLRSVTIPESVTVLSHIAFYDCKELTDLYYGGTRAQWKALKGHLKLNETVTVHCADDETTAVTEEMTARPEEEPTDPTTDTATPEKDTDRPNENESVTVAPNEDLTTAPNEDSTTTPDTGSSSPDEDSTAAPDTGSSSPDEDTTTAPDAGSSSPDEGTTTAPSGGENEPAIDFDGEEFTILSVSNFNYPILGDTEASDMINQASYKRSALVETKYNLALNEQFRTRDDAWMFVQNAYMAGDNAFDLMFLSANGTQLQIPEAFCNLAQMPALSLDAEWWYGDYNEQLTFNNRLYFAAGGAHVGVLNNVTALAFNRDLFADYGLEEPYETVLNGEWTVEKLAEIVHTVATDFEGTGDFSWNENGSTLYGLLSLSPAATVNAFMQASGVGSLEKNGDGVLSFSANKERYIYTAEKLQMLFDQGYSVCINDATALLNAFNKGRAAFLRLPSLTMLQDLSQMDAQFGILPMPKGDVVQADYHTLVNSYSTPVAFVPTVGKDAERAAAVLELLAYHGTEIVTDALRDYNFRFTQTPMDMEMLDIIHAGICPDVSYAFGYPDSRVLSETDKFVMGQSGSLMPAIITYEAIVERALRDAMQSVYGVTY